MKLPNALQMKELDVATIQEEEISSYDLMERAASQLASFIYTHYENKNRPVVIFCGPGNNGGDGLAVARKMSQHGYAQLQVFLFNTSQSLSEDCQTNMIRLQTECPNVTFTEITQQFEAPQLAANTLVIDALFGTGLGRPLGGGFAALVQFINASGTEVISIDMPSGLMSEDNTLNSPSAIVRATVTLTLGLPKLALILPDTQVFAGKVYVLPIGLSETKIAELQTPFQITEHAEMRALLRPRPAFGHKGTFGNGLLIAGRYGMAGAAVLAARACLRAGVGKVTIHTPTCNNDILQIAVPEAVLHHDTDERVFSKAIHSEAFQAVAIGPGIGTEKRTALALIEQVSHSALPLVIDADAINIFGSHKGWIAQIPQHSIFTPHPTEMKRLGICNNDSFSILLEAINLAKRHHFYIVLKGHYTAVCTPKGYVYFNPTGNSGMATAGSGDVLTGIILALLAQQYPQEAACRLGVYLHGLAGDLAAQERGEYALTASDLIDFLPQAFACLQQQESLPWSQRFGLDWGEHTK